MVHDPNELLEGQFQVVIDHHVVGHGNADGLFFFGLSEAFFDFVLGIPPAAQATLLLEARGRKKEDEDGIGVDQFHLTSTRSRPSTTSGNGVP